MIRFWLRLHSIRCYYDTFDTIPFLHYHHSIFWWWCLSIYSIPFIRVLSFVVFIHIRLFCSTFYSFDTDGVLRFHSTFRYHSHHSTIYDWFLILCSSSILHTHFTTTVLPFYLPLFCCPTDSVAHSSYILMPSRRYTYDSLPLRLRYRCWPLLILRCIPTFDSYTTWYDQSHSIRYRYGDVCSGTVACSCHSHSAFYSIIGGISVPTFRCSVLPFTLFSLHSTSVGDYHSFLGILPYILIHLPPDAILPISTILFPFIPTVLMIILPHHLFIWHSIFYIPIHSTLTLPLRYTTFVIPDYIPRYGIRFIYRSFEIFDTWYVVMTDRYKFDTTHSIYIPLPFGDGTFWWYHSIYIVIRWWWSLRWRYSICWWWCSIPFYIHIVHCCYSFLLIWYSFSNFGIPGVTIISVGVIHSFADADVVTIHWYIVVRCCCSPLFGIHIPSIHSLLLFWRLPVHSPILPFYSLRYLTVDVLPCSRWCSDTCCLRYRWYDPMLFWLFRCSDSDPDHSTDVRCVTLLMFIPICSLHLPTILPLFTFIPLPRFTIPIRLHRYVTIRCTLPVFLITTITTISTIPVVRCWYSRCWALRPDRSCSPGDCSPPLLHAIFSFYVLLSLRCSFDGYVHSSTTFWKPFCSRSLPFCSTHDRYRLRYHLFTFWYHVGGTTHSCHHHTGRPLPTGDTDTPLPITPTPEIHRTGRSRSIHSTILPLLFGYDTFDTGDTMPLLVIRAPITIRPCRYRCLGLCVTTLLFAGLIPVRFYHRVVHKFSFLPPFHVHVWFTTTTFVLPTITTDTLPRYTTALRLPHRYTTGLRWKILEFHACYHRLFGFYRYDSVRYTTFTNFLFGDFTIRWFPVTTLMRFTTTFGLVVASVSFDWFVRLIHCYTFISDIHIPHSLFILHSMVISTSTRPHFVVTILPPGVPDTISFYLPRFRIPTILFILSFDTFWAFTIHSTFYHSFVRWCSRWCLHSYCWSCICSDVPFYHRFYYTYHRSYRYVDLPFRPNCSFIPTVRWYSTFILHSTIYHSVIPPFLPIHVHSIRFDSDILFIHCDAIRFPRFIHIQFFYLCDGISFTIPIHYHFRYRYRLLPPYLLLFYDRYHSLFIHLMIPTDVRYDAIPLMMIRCSMPITIPHLLLFSFDVRVVRAVFLRVIHCSIVVVFILLFLPSHILRWSFPFLPIHSLHSVIGIPVHLLFTFVHSTILFCWCNLMLPTTFTPFCSVLFWWWYILLTFPFIDTFYDTLHCSTWYFVYLFPLRYHTYLFDTFCSIPTLRFYILHHSTVTIHLFISFPVDCSPFYCIHYLIPHWWVIPDGDLRPFPRCSFPFHSFYWCYCYSTVRAALFCSHSPLFIHSTLPHILISCLPTITQFRYHIHSLFDSHGGYILWADTFPFSTGISLFYVLHVPPIFVRWYICSVIVALIRFYHHRCCCSATYHFTVCSTDTGTTPPLLFHSFIHVSTLILIDDTRFVHSLHLPLFYHHIRCSICFDTVFILIFIIHSILFIWWYSIHSFITFLIHSIRWWCSDHSLIFIRYSMISIHCCVRYSIHCYRCSISTFIYCSTFLILPFHSLPVVFYLIDTFYSDTILFWCISLFSFSDTGILLMILFGEIDTFYRFIYHSTSVDDTPFVLCCCVIVVHSFCCSFGDHSWWLLLSSLHSFIPFIQYSDAYVLFWVIYTFIHSYFHTYISVVDRCSLFTFCRSTGVHCSMGGYSHTRYHIFTRYDLPFDLHHNTSLPISY